MQYTSVIASLTLALLASAACNRAERPAETGKPSATAELSGSRSEELKDGVPGGFSESAQWNRADVCPEGSQLSPLTRYAYGPGERSYGFTHYYGRSCNIVIPRQDSVTLVPNGPFIWWYENGKRMSSGNFDHGTLATDWSRWQPDGSLASK